MVSALLTLLVLGIAGLVVAALVLAVLGVVFSIAFGVAGLLLLKVAPLLLLGWIVLRLVKRGPPGRHPPARQISRADREWLDS